MHMKGIKSNGFLPIIAQAIAEMEETHGEFSSIDEVNLAELGRRTGLSRAKLRRLRWMVSLRRYTKLYVESS